MPKIVICWSRFENLYVDLPNENLGDILQSIATRKSEQLINHDFSVLLGAACGMIGAISFFKTHFRFLKETEANPAFRL